MSAYGYIGCRDCKEIIFLGKWSSDKSSFFHGKLSDGSNTALLGEKVLKFIASHLNHDVFAGSDEGGIVSDDYFDIYKDMDKEYGDP